MRDETSIKGSRGGLASDNLTALRNRRPALPMSEHDTEQWLSRLAAQVQRLATGLRWLSANCLDRCDGGLVGDRHERIDR